MTPPEQRTAAIEARLNAATSVMSNAAQYALNAHAPADLAYLLALVASLRAENERLAWRAFNYAKENADLGSLRAEVAALTERLTAGADAVWHDAVHLGGVDALAWHMARQAKGQLPERQEEDNDELDDLADDSWLQFIGLAVQALETLRDNTRPFSPEGAQDQ